MTSAQHGPRAVPALALTAALAAASVAVVIAPAHAQETAAAGAITQRHSLGSVDLTLEAAPRSMAIDGHLRLTLLVEAPAGSILSFPEVAASLGPFVVASQSAPGPSAITGGRELWRRDLVLEAEGVGELAVPGLTVTVQDEAARAADVRQITTDPMTVTITSVVPADADISEPKDIAPPVPLPRAGVGWLPWLLGAALVALAGLALVVWRRRKRQAAPAEPRPAHLLALAELERLQAAAGGQAGAEELYLGLADVLRRYVVARFGLRARAQTTEELLATATRAAGPLAGLRHLIGPVLASCDLVKFARHRPGPGDLPIQLRQARDFIEQTADDQVRVASPATAPS
jgi:hypothetical protein